MTPHVFFWPFDIGPAPHEKERTRAATHIADWLRLGVLAQEEGAELRWQAHMMECPLCHEPALSLWEEASGWGLTQAQRGLSCLQARNEVFRYLEQGRALQVEVLGHLASCPSCAEHFLEVAKVLYRREVDEEAIAAQD